MIRVLIADDQRLIREGISSLLAIQEGMEIIGTAVNGAEALAMARELNPDVILMDVQMPETNGIQATEQIRKERLGCQVIMLTTFDDDEYIVKSLRAGAVGYLLKDIPPGDLAQAIRLAHSGIFQLSPSVAGKLVGDIRELPLEPAGEIPDMDLTDREMEVLKLIAQGASNREIGDRLFVSEGTVKNHVSSILNRLNLRDRTQAALFAHKNRLI